MSSKIDSDSQPSLKPPVTPSHSSIFCFLPISVLAMGVLSAVMLRTEPASLSLPGPSGSGFPSLRRGRLAASVPDAPPLSRRCLRSLHPGKKPPGCKAQRRFARRAFRRCGGSLLIPVSGASHPFKSLSPGLRQARSSSSVQGKWHAVNRALDSCCRPCPFTPLRRRFSNG